MTRQVLGHRERLTMKVMTTMTKKLVDPSMTDSENREWSSADFAKAKDISSLPSSLRKKLRGRPKVVQPKVPISLRLATDVLEEWKSTGAGWQTAMSETLATTRVNLDESWEVAFWTKELGVTEAQLKKAVKAAGAMPGSVRLWLRKAG
jgi:uncharacterized protein (DUF4415 family)